MLLIFLIADPVAVFNADTNLVGVLKICLLVDSSKVGLLIEVDVLLLDSSELLAWDFNSSFTMGSDFYGSDSSCSGSLGLFLVLALVLVLGTDSSEVLDSSELSDSKEEEDVLELLDSSELLYTSKLAESLEISDLEKEEEEEDAYLWREHLDFLVCFSFGCSCLQVGCLKFVGYLDFLGPSSSEVV